MLEESLQGGTLLVFLYLGIVIVIIVCCAITEYYTQHFQQKQISWECQQEAIVKFLLYKLVDTKPLQFRTSSTEKGHHGSGSGWCSCHSQ